MLDTTADREEPTLWSSTAGKNRSSFIHSTQFFSITLFCILCLSIFPPHFYSLHHVVAITGVNQYIFQGYWGLDWSDWPRWRGDVEVGGRHSTERWLNAHRALSLFNLQHYEWYKEDILNLYVFRFWWDKEPNNYNGDEDCVVTGSKFAKAELSMWADYSCHFPVLAICEMNANK